MSLTSCVETGGDGAPPPPRLPQAGITDMVASFEDFVIVTWAVDPARVRPHVPARFALEMIPVGDVSRALVSLVVYGCRNLRPAAGVPFPAIAFEQANLRTYVRDPRDSRRGVWFIASVMDSWLAHLGRLIGPVRRGRIDITWRDGSDGRARYSATVRRSSFEASIELAKGGAPSSLPGFPSVEAGVAALGDPTAGFYPRTIGGIGEAHVWHPRLTPLFGEIVLAEIPVLDRLAIVPLAEQAVAHSVLLDRHIDFVIRAPWKDR